ncbi:hypothetical protein AL540_022240 [Vibrio harveyi]|nr:hypothetical protein AL540_022240 [Vibrio harveyi]
MSQEIQVKYKKETLVAVFLIGSLFGVIAGVKFGPKGQQVVSILKAISEIVLPWVAVFIACYGLNSWKHSHVYTEKYNIVRKLNEQMQSVTGKAKELYLYNRLLQRNSFPRASSNLAQLTEELKRIQDEFALELHKYKQVQKDFELYEIEGDFTFPHESYIKLCSGISEVYLKNSMSHVSELEGELALIDASMEELLVSLEGSVRTLKSNYFRT